jgi:rhodanese-related sulfurtransferase
MELVAEAKEAIENLTPAQVAAELGQPGVVLVDLREPAEIEAQGTIQGAIHAPRGMLEFHADPSSPHHLEGLDPALRTILYDSWGGRSALACATLKKLGYRSVSHLEGGFKAWMAAGYPVESAPPGASAPVAGFDNLRTGLDGADQVSDPSEGRPDRQLLPLEPSSSQASAHEHAPDQRGDLLAATPITPLRPSLKGRES